MTKDYPRKIKNLTNRINYGVYDGYDELCQLRREYARTLNPVAGGAVDIPRAALRLLDVDDFPVGALVRCGKYRIWCRGRRTTVSMKDNLFVDLQMRKWPLYIKEFVGGI